MNRPQVFDVRVGPLCIVALAAQQNPLIAIFGNFVDRVETLAAINPAEER